MIAMKNFEMPENCNKCDLTNECGLCLVDNGSCDYNSGYRPTTCPLVEVGKWIPCSERMPEVTDHYLIQYSRHICRDEMAVAFYSVEEAESDSNYTWEFKPFADCKEVIAWMPLPQPYKAEREE